MNGQVPLPYILLGRLFASAFVIESERQLQHASLAVHHSKAETVRQFGLPTEGRKVLGGTDTTTRLRSLEGTKVYSILYDATFAVCSLLMHIT